MSAFVTGATGFIGRHLMERLLAREGDVHVLVREGSEQKLDVLARRWGHPDRVHPVAGDLSRPRLGLGRAGIGRLRGQVDHLFHLAAVYDMTADEQRNRVANVEGTRHAVQLGNALEVGCFHQVSSVAAAGMYRGTFREDMFDEGQALEHPYHATKFESERIAREETATPWRVYRPAVVVGDSRTGEMDKIDGPYYFFRLLRAGSRLPSWLPLVAPDLGDTNVVPVDFVADAIDVLAHRDRLDGRAFHLCNPEPQPSVDVLNAFARVAGAPRIAVSVGGRPAAWAATRGTQALTRLPVVGTPVRALLAQAGIPEQVLAYLGFSARFDTTATQEALAGSGVGVPPLDSYAEPLWDYWEANLR